MAKKRDEIKKGKITKSKTKEKTTNKKNVQEKETLFKNTVGRPTNEIKKKRQMFAAIIIAIVLVAVLGIFLLLNMNESQSRRLKGNLSSTYGMQKISNGYRSIYISNDKLNMVYYPMGDADLDGIITEADATYALRYSARLEQNDKGSLREKLMDMNGDGKIYADDARKILRIVNKLDSYTYVQKKYCLVPEKESMSSYCKWDKIKANSLVTYPLEKNNAYTIFEYDVNSKTSNGVYFFEYRGGSSSVYKNGKMIRMTKYEDNWSIGSYKMLYVDSNSDIEKVVSSNPNVIRVSVYKSSDKKNIIYKLSAIGRGKATITAKNKDGVSVSHTYNSFFDGLSPNEVYGKGNYTYRKINDRYNDGTYVNLYIDNTAPKACVNAYTDAIDAMTNNSKFYYSGTTRRSVDTVFIFSNEKWDEQRLGDGAAGLTWSSFGQVALKCYLDYNTDFGKNDAKVVTYHEFGHAISGKYYVINGIGLDDKYTPQSFVDSIAEYNKKADDVKYYKILTNRNGYAFKNTSEFFAQLTAAYSLDKINNYSTATRKELGLIYGGTPSSAIKSAFEDASKVIYYGLSSQNKTTTTTTKKATVKTTTTKKIATTKKTTAKTTTKKVVTTTIKKTTAKTTTKKVATKTTTTTTSTRKLTSSGPKKPTTGTHAGSCSGILTSRAEKATDWYTDGYNDKNGRPVYYYNKAGYSVLKCKKGYNETTCLMPGEYCSYESETLKYYIKQISQTVNGNFETYAITYVWAKDPYNQLHTAIAPHDSNYISTPSPYTKIMNNEISNKGYSKKGLVGVNASPMISQKYSYADYSKKSWLYQPAVSMLIDNGKVIREPNTSYWVFGGNTSQPHKGLTKDGYLTHYYFYKDDAARTKKSVDKIKSDGVKHLFTFKPVLVYKGESKYNSLTNDDTKKAWKKEDIRQAVGQIDLNNFVFITSTLSSSRGDRTNGGLSYKRLAEIMTEELQVYNGYNLDGGGSTSYFYKANTSTLKGPGPQYSGRMGGDILYFVEK